MLGFAFYSNNKQQLFFYPLGKKIMLFSSFRVWMNIQPLNSTLMDNIMKQLLLDQEMCKPVSIWQLKVCWSIVRCISKQILGVIWKSHLILIGQAAVDELFMVVSCCFPWPYICGNSFLYVWIKITECLPILLLGCKFSDKEKIFPTYLWNFDTPTVTY